MGIIVDLTEFNEALLERNLEKERYTKGGLGTCVLRSFNEICKSDKIFCCLSILHGRIDNTETSQISVRLPSSSFPIFIDNMFYLIQIKIQRK